MHTRAHMLCTQACLLTSAHLPAAPIILAVSIIYKCILSLHLPLPALTRM